MRLSSVCFSILAGCHCSGTVDNDDTAADTIPDSTPDSVPVLDTVDSGAPDDTPIQAECTEPAALPVQSETMRGFIPAEDFVLDGEGYLVGIDYGGNLIGINQDGDRKVILPNAGQWTSGMHQMLDGSFVYSDAATGSLMRVQPGGGAEVVVSGMAYPNGIEVDPEGIVYVSEHDAGRVRRIDPETGEYSFVAQGLHHPNGLQFSTDYQTLYVTSFGGGTVHAMKRISDEVWEEPLLMGYVPSIDPSTIPIPCADGQVGDACLMVYGGVGQCSDGGDGDLSCDVDRDHAACEGLNAGDACETTLMDQAITSVCVEQTDIVEDAFCPRAEDTRIEQCAGQTAYSNCRFENEYGYCVAGWEGAMVCVVDSDYDLMEDGCDGLELGDDCSTMYPSGPWTGTCTDYSHHWGVVCEPWFGWGEKGGLDGIAVDACDNIYVSEYVSGDVYRYAPDGSAIELVYETGATWVPNMHWGNGIGGWEEDVLYVLNRDNGNVHALQVNVHGVLEAYIPGHTDAE